MIESHHGQPSYRIENRQAVVHVSIQGGHLTAVYRLAGREAAPYFINPWWKEAGAAELGDLIRVLRGDFFCFPFGANADPFDGVKHPVHGITANACWDPLEAGEEGGAPRLRLRLGLPGGKGTVIKTVAIAAQAPVIYSEHLIRGFSGKMPLGHHATLQFPAAESSGMIDLAAPLAGFTHPTPVELPANRGYSLLKPDIEIVDPTRVPTVYGDTVDLTRYPQRAGHEDVAQFLSDPARELAWSSVSFPGEGYLYFQLKDPKVLSSTLLWRSNGGRHYFPWNGRLRGVLGLEEVVSCFALGVRPSVEPNPLQRRGFPTFLEIREDRPAAIRVITGCAAIGPDFTGVRDIRRGDGASIAIEGKSGESIAVPCRLDFLRQGF